MTVRKPRVTIYERRVASSYMDLYKQAYLFLYEVAKEWCWFLPKKEEKKKGSLD